MQSFGKHREFIFAQAEWPIDKISHTRTIESIINVAQVDELKMIGSCP